MRMPKKVLPHWAVLFTAFCLPISAAAQTIPNGAAIDAEVSKIMTHTRARGMAVAVLDHGKVGHVHAYGIRNAKGDPLTTDTVMYGASLTKITPQSASRPVSVVSSSCRTMFAPRRASLIWSGSSSATRACPTTGNMATRLESREFQ